MPDFLKMGLVLMVVGLVSTAILAGTEHYTRAPIAAARQEETMRALSHILPQGFNNEPVQDTIELADKRLNRREKPVVFYRSRLNGGNHGAAFTVTAPDGYSGDIEIMMGVTSGGVVSGVQIVAHAETPGLGDKIVTTNWASSFSGKSLDNTVWGVKKDGGNFDQFAGATITPRAIVRAVKRGLEFFVENEAKIFQSAQPATSALAPQPEPVK